MKFDTLHENMLATSYGEDQLITQKLFPMKPL